MLDVAYARPAERFLDKTHKILAGRITERIEELRKNPFPPKCKRLKGMPFSELALGGYRIVYQVENNILFIVDIVKRNNVF